MSIKRLVTRANSMAIKRKWGSRSIQLDRSYLPDVSMPSDEAVVQTIAIPTGKSVSSVRLYSYHDIYGTIEFNTAEDLEDFYQTNADSARINPDEGTMIQGNATYVRDILFQPSGMDAAWDQPMDNTVIEINVPYFQVFNESAYHILEVRFNHGEDKGGGANYSKFWVEPDTVTGSPNQNQLTFTLQQINYGTQQGTDDTCTDLRKYPTYAGDDVGYRIRFYIDLDTDQVHVKILGDYSGASEQTLTKSWPPGVDYCSQHYWNIYTFFADPDESSTAKTAIDDFRILKGDDETGNRLVYKVSRDGGSNWATLNVDSWLTSGYGYSDLDLSSQGAGDGELLLQIAMKWPALVKGFGLAWDG